MRIGVLAVQGAFVEHIAALEKLEVEALPVRLPAELAGLDGLVIPGGESTTISQLMLDYDLASGIRNLAERSKKIREVVFKLAGKKAAQNSLGEIEVGDLSVILDANPFHELTAIEQVVRSQQDRLLVLQKARDALNWVDQIGDTDGLKYVVLENDGVPERILLKIS